MRGFGYNRLGTRDEQGNVIGGRALAVVSVEAEQWFTKAWGMALFYDVGNAMHSFGEPLAMGAGPGLRWRSPVGVMRVDLGVPLTGGQRLMQLHLSIGPGL